MNESKGRNAIFKFAGLLLCIILIQTTFAAENQSNINSSDNSIFANDTTQNSTIENSTVEDPLTGDLESGGIIDNGINDNATSEAVAHSINPSYYYRYLTAGYSTEFNVNFINNDDEDVVIAPKVIAASEMNGGINESWITISPANATVAPGSEQHFVIEVNAPWDATGGYHYGKIVFTEDMAPNNEWYDEPQYLNSMGLSLDVQAPPKIQLETDYISDTLDAGTENVYRIKIKNVAPRDLTINPNLSTSSNYYYYEDYKQAFDNDAIEISAPSIIKAGEITNITMKVNVPENATGNYNRYIYMDVNGKGDDWSIPRLNLHFNILKPLNPFVKTFYTSTNDPVTIEVSGDSDVSYNKLRVTQKKDKPPFGLELTCNSKPVNMSFEESAESGGANIDNYYYYYPSWALDNGRSYQNINNHYVATYKAPGKIGEWQLSIFPKGVSNFKYLIKIKENNQEEIWNVTSNNTSTEDPLIEEVTNENISTETLEMPVADFSSDVTSGSVPLSVQFTDLSENAAEWNWNFGDGIHSTIDDPTHIYSKAGKYTVSLTVKNEKGSDTESKHKYILVSKK